MVVVMAEVAKVAAAKAMGARVAAVMAAGAKEGA